MSINDLSKRLRRRNKASEEASSKTEEDDGAINEDFGLGNKVARKPGTRLINQKGEFNVERRGASIFSPYQQLVEMGWGYFLLLTLTAYIVVNFLFAIGFILIGIESLRGLSEVNTLGDHLAHAFFFSVQTFTTVGYGAVSPDGAAANILASIVALVGLLGLALATGLVFARFAQPKSLIRFSDQALIGPYLDKGLNSLQFRIANVRDTHLINLRANVVLSWLEDSGPGLVSKRRFAPLELERSFVALFPLNWTIVHPITKDSPIYGWDKEQFCRNHSEILIMIEGYDQTYAQKIHANSSYIHSEVAWQARFAPMYSEEESTTILHLDRISKMIVLEEE